MTLTNQDIYKPVRKTLDIKRHNAIAATGEKKRTNVIVRNLDSTKLIESSKLQVNNKRRNCEHEDCVSFSFLCS
jgi:hypothetical protein